MDDDERKSKQELLAEVRALRQQVAALQQTHTEEQARLHHQLIETQQQIIQELSTLRFLQKLVDTIPSPIFYKDVDGIYLGCNTAFEIYLGLPREALIGQTVYDITTPDVATKHQQMDALLFQQPERAQVYEMAVRYADGTLHNVIFYKAIFSNVEGKPAGLVGMMLDITQRKELEQQIQESLDRRTRQIQMSTEVAQEVAAAPNSKILFCRMVSLIQERFGYYYTHVYMLEGDLLVMQAGSGKVGLQMMAIGHAIPLTTERSLVAYAARSGEVALVPDVRHSSRWLPNPFLPETRSELAVPIKLMGEVLGVLDIQSNEVDGLGQEDQILLMGLCGQIGVAINSRRVEAQRWQAEEALRQSEQRHRRRAAELQALYDTSLRLNAQLEPSQLLHSIVEQIIPLVQAHDGCLYIYEAEANELVCQVGVGCLSDCVGAMLKPGQGPLGQVFTSGRPYSNEHYAPGESSCAQEAQLGGVLAIPLRGQKGILGVLEVGNCEEKTTFDEYDLQLAELFATQAAMALENARLYAEARRRAREVAALNKASRAIVSTLDLDTVLDQMMVVVKALFGADGASVLLREQASEALIFAAVVSASSTMQVGLHLPLDKGIASWVVREKQPVIVEDAQSDPRFYQHIDTISGITTRSLMAVPLIFKERTIGVIEVINKAKGTFTQADLELMEGLTSSAAIAIANAQLYKMEREQFRRLEQSQAQLIHFEKMAALGQLMASIAHEINNPLQAVQTCLALIEEEIDDGKQLKKLAHYAGVAHHESERIGAIVHRMCTLYRPQRNEDASHLDSESSEEQLPYIIRHKLQSVDLHATLEDILRLAEEQLRYNHIQVQRLWAAELPSIRGNPEHLKQVFLSLILNAIDAMAPQGGVLSVQTMVDQLQLSHKAPQPAVRLEFRDTGKGMGAELLTRIFEPLFTTKEYGSGFGLFTSKKIVEVHQGQISVVSRVGEGTTFTILLPIP